MRASCWHAGYGVCRQNQIRTSNSEDMFRFCIVCWIVSRYFFRKFARGIFPDSMDDGYRLQMIQNRSIIV